mgnify:CR=1 FL=1
MRDGVYRFSNDGRVSTTRGLLADYAYSIKAFIRLYDITGDRRWLARSQALADEMTAEFWDPSLGLYTEAPRNQQTLFINPVSTNDGAQPSGASVAVFALLELGRRLADPEVEQRAAQALAGISGRAAVAPTAHGSIWRSVFRRLAPGEASSGTAVTAAGIVRGWIEEGQLVLSIAPGWHINSFTPRQDNLVGTQVRFERQNEALAASPPQPKLTELSFSNQPLETYEGTLRLPLADVSGKSSGRLLVDVQACDDRRCLPPETLALPLPY